MSYTQSFSSSVTVNGSQSAYYHYPASEHGGSGSVTVHYSETVPINVNIHVNTAPFDSSVANAAANVDALTGAVVAMNASQCQSVQKASDEISASVTKGFFKLIGSEITTQISENKNSLKAKIALIVELAKDIFSKHERMKTDLGRLKKHYSQIFSALDSDCKKRVFSLDKAAFYLFNARKKILTEPYFNAGGFFLQESADSSNFQNLFSVARLKNKTENVISVMAASAFNSKKYLKDIEKISENVAAKEKIVFHIPVVFSEQKNIEQESGSQIFCFFASDANSKEQIQKKVNDFVLGTRAEQWKNFSESEMRMIEKNFFALAERDLNAAGASNAEDGKRVYEEIVKLWKSNSAKTF